MTLRFHRRSLSMPLGLLLCGILLPVTLPADTFILRNGGEVHGEWLNVGESPQRSYLVKTETGIQLRLSSSQVTKCIRQTDAIREYDCVAPTFADTVAGQTELAEWCSKHGLTQQRRRHLRRIVELDPKNATAWQALGYTEYDGRWVTRQDYFEERGYVYYRGRWRLPQEVAVFEELRRVDELERDWIEQLKTWRSQLEAENNAEVARRIASIEDPMAIRAIGQNLQRERNSQVRLLYITALSHIPDRRALAMLVSTALRDPDLEVFHECEDLILKTQVSGLSKELAKSLKDPQNVRVNRAAHVLGRLGDPTAVPALIEALVTTHYVPNYSNGGRTTATLVQPTADSNMSSLGGGPATPVKDAAFSTGNGAAFIPVPVHNQEVLQALVRLAGGQSFGFDRQGWLNWWALSTRAQASPALR